MPKLIRQTLDRVIVARHTVPAGDLFWLAGAGLVAGGAALERLSAGLIVAGLLVLVLAIGATRAR
jgi:hypothetical protein